MELRNAVQGVSAGTFSEGYWNMVSKTTHTMVAVHGQTTGEEPVVNMPT
jgi:hypothetical protein